MASYAAHPLRDPEDIVPDVVRESRTLPWREAAKESDALRPMLMEQFRHEDFRGKLVLDVGTGEGRLAFVAAHAGARVVGVDLDRTKLMHARAYAGIRDFRNVEFVLGDVDKTPYHEFAQREAAEVALDVAQRHHDAAENEEQVDQQPRVSEERAIDPCIVRERREKSRHQQKMVDHHRCRGDTPDAVERQDMRFLTMNQLRHIDIP